MPASQKPLRLLIDLLARLTLVAFVMATALVLAHFPYDSDDALSSDELRKTRDYYARAYKAPPEEEPEGPNRERYVKIAALAAAEYKIEDQVRDFVSRYDLKRKRVLEVGAGRGYLQDMVDDYTGLDISSSARRFFHKPFVLGSATAMPFEDNSFDALWSIWVLEHIPAPEQALNEIRRVVKPGGHIFLMPAWNIMPWVAGGYNVRPYSDLDAAGKLIKASILPRTYLYVMAQHAIRPVRSRWSGFTGRPSRLRYRRLEPNYDIYWGPDADAVNRLDRYETAVWFTSRGDRWLNRGEEPGMEFDGPLVLKVVKGAPAGRTETLLSNR